MCMCVRMYLQVEPPAAGEGNCAGLQAGVGLGAVEVLVVGPVQVGVDPTALQLKQSRESGDLAGPVTAGDPPPTPTHLPLEEVHQVLQVPVLPVEKQRPLHHRLRPLHHLAGSRRTGCRGTGSQRDRKSGPGSSRTSCPEDTSCLHLLPVLPCQSTGSPPLQPPPAAGSQRSGSLQTANRKEPLGEAGDIIMVVQSTAAVD